MVDGAATSTAPTVSRPAVRLSTGVGSVSDATRCSSGESPCDSTRIWNRDTARPLWRMKLTTMGDLFRLRFGAGVEKLAVLLMVPTSILWAGAQVRAIGDGVVVFAGEAEAGAKTVAFGTRTSP